VASSPLTAQKRYAGTGRPTPRLPLTASAWHIQAHVHADDAARERDKHTQACSVLGTHIDASEWNAAEGITAYTGQSQVEGGWRFLKDPRFFGSALLVKKPRRLAGLLLVMTLALFVYSVAQRRLRAPLATDHETVPNHMKQPTTSPT
jgi:transposase